MNQFIEPNKWKQNVSCCKKKPSNYFFMTILSIFNQNAKLELIIYFSSVFTYRIIESASLYWGSLVIIVEMWTIINKEWKKCEKS